MVILKKIIKREPRSVKVDACQSLGTSTHSGAEELVVDFGLSISLHDVVALRLKVGGGGAHVHGLLQRGVDPEASQFGGKDERQI